ncbi:arabinogalactan peptide 23-like [Prunus avium]|uniref:Arabinogalactan peptide 23-like n=1 Tax=Prunus avium TaxID=42229 RepID=A0A6P5T6M6_PRUAV|nr:arabinogalactan peptide 23-like [Prunus avium]
MEMKKIVCAVLFAAASVSAVMAHEGHAYTHSPAPAPGPEGAANDASASLPVLGSLVGAYIVSFIAYYMQ